MGRMLAYGAAGLQVRFKFGSGAVSTARENIRVQTVSAPAISSHARLHMSYG